MSRVRHIGTCPLTRQHVRDERQCIGCDGCDMDETVHMATANTIFPSLNWMDRAEMDPRELVRMGLDVPCVDQMDLSLGEIDEDIFFDSTLDNWGEDPLTQYQKIHEEFPDFGEPVLNRFLTSMAFPE